MHLGRTKKMFSEVPEGMAVALCEFVILKEKRDGEGGAWRGGEKKLQKLFWSKERE